MPFNKQMKLNALNSVPQNGRREACRGRGLGLVAVDTSAGAGPVSLGLLAVLVLLLTCRGREQETDINDHAAGEEGDGTDLHTKRPEEQ